jgi:glucosamine--fructose-6-phosphate aminotransferase (isomerizing)
MSRLLEEIAEQPDVLVRVSEKFVEQRVVVDELVKKIHSGVYSNIILTGMGASYYSCYPLWLKLSHMGFPISLWDTSELVNFAPNSIRNTTLLIAVSQSGESAEIKKLVALEGKPGFRVGITNSTDNCLAGKSDLLLQLSAGEERSVSTKTYLASLAVLHLLGSKIIGQSLEEEIVKLHSVADKMRAALSDLTKQIEGLSHFLRSVKQVMVLGRGFSLASANYGALILEEAARFSATGLSAAQFRHGPMEIVNPTFNAIVLGGSKNIWEMNRTLVKDIAALGGRVVLISPEREMCSTGSVLPWVIPSVEDELLPMLEILPLQQLVIYFASSQGFEAGVFKNSGKVTFIE